VLRDKGIITSRQYEDAVNERQAAGAVELALNQEWSRKKAVLAEHEAGARARDTSGFC
jgi:hypothetical protein